MNLGFGFQFLYFVCGSKRENAVLRASGPDMRTTDIPPAPCGVDMAAMVSGLEGSAA
jgi:hypothetical protein